MGAKPGGVQGFWENFKSSAAGKRMWRLHPWLQGREPSDLRWHLPLMLFDDAGPVSNISSTFVRCWYSVLGIGSDRETRYLCATGLKEASATEDKSWSVIISQFGHLAQPAAAGSWGGILLFIGADMEYMCNMLGMPPLQCERCVWVLPSERLGHPTRRLQCRGSVASDHER